jgi:hypothetical protein
MLVDGDREGEVAGGHGGDGDGLRDRKR